MKFDENDPHLLVIMGIIILGATTVLLVKYMRTLTKNTDLNDLKLRQQQLAHENELLVTRQEVQENTFQQINRELHDNIKQLLVLSRTNQMAVKVTDQKDQHKLRSSIESIEQAMANVDDISRSLSTEWIAQIGLIRVLEDEIERINVMGLYAIEDLIDPNYTGLAPESELHIYRIVQEAFNNIIKHSGANRISFSLECRPDQLFIIIKDNGKGIAEAGFEDKRIRMGLSNLKLRAKIINGELTIDSKPAIGTSICLSVPFSKNLPSQQT